MPHKNEYKMFSQPPRYILEAWEKNSIPMRICINQLFSIRSQEEIDRLILACDEFEYRTVDKNIFLITILERVCDKNLYVTNMRKIGFLNVTFALKYESLGDVMVRLHEISFNVNLDILQ